MGLIYSMGGAGGDWVSEKADAFGAGFFRLAALLGSWVLARRAFLMGSSVLGQWRSGLAFSATESPLGVSRDSEKSKN